VKGAVVLWAGELLSLPAFPNSVFFGKARAFPEFFLTQAKLERTFFLSWLLVREGRMAGIFVAVWLDSCSSRVLGTLHRDSYSDAEV